MDNATIVSRGSALTRFWQMPAAALVALALVGSAACSGNDDMPEPTPAAASATSTSAPTAAATATPAPTTSVVRGIEATLPAGDVGQMMQMLIEAMSDPDSELFSGSIEAIPPELRALLDALGADLLLGVVTVDLGVGVGVGVVVVIPDSSAAHGGLAEGDRIAAIDGAPVGSGAALHAAVAALAEGTAYSLTIDRGGSAQMIEVERESASDGNAWRAELLRSLALLLALQDVPGGPDVPSSLLGEMAEETADGLLVFAVFPGSPADIGGVRPGDLLVSVAGHALTTFADLEALMLSFNPTSGKVEVVLLRDGEELTLEISLPAGGMFGAGAATQ